MEQKQEQKSPDCKHCEADGKEHVVKNGYDYQGGKTQRYLCKKCGKTFTVD